MVFTGDNMQIKLPTLNQTESFVKTGIMKPMADMKLATMPMMLSERLMMLVRIGMITHKLAR